MIGKALILQATLLVLVNSFSVIDPSFFYQQPFVFHEPIPYEHPPIVYQQPTVSGWKQLELRNEDQSLPCPWEGFLVHPKNCTRFYRCVDYAGTGYLFSRYMFECPTNNVFVIAAQTCLPGVCTGLPPQPTIMPATPATAEATTWPSEESESVAPEAESPVSTTDAPAATEVVTESPFATESPTEASATDLPPSSNPPVDTCPNKYVQHAEYCNIYHPCGNANERYVCPAGTAFDQPGQMCRISAQDENLCGGKGVFQDPLLLRTYEMGTLIRLPDSYILPSVHHGNYLFGPIPDPFQNYVWPQHPVNEPAFPTASPAQLYLWPTSRPTATSLEDGNVKFRPLLQRPEMNNGPFQFAATFNSAFNDGPSPFVPDQPRPFEQVRRPVGHFHIPQYLAPDFFGFHRDITLE